jgi:DNA-binding transcriptional MerR regulator
VNLPAKSLAYDVTSYLILDLERRQHLETHVYHTSQFAEKAAVSVRTLRYYDKVGLLSPSRYTEAGFRLYTDEDFPRLQQILALKFLGFSLAEIQQCLRFEPTFLRESLARQKAMMQEKRWQLDTVIQALDATENALRANHNGDWEPIIRVIQVMQMTQTNDWRKKYFTEEQLSQMEELSKKSYSEEDRQKIAEWGKNWSEADQQVATQQWDAVIAELKRLAAEGADPASPEAQALAAQWWSLIQQFTHGDPGVTQGLKNMYRNLDEMPEQERPFPMPYTEQEEAYMQKLINVYQQKQK